MGQRLNIQIEANNTDTNEIVVLANCYYHWSGYTSIKLFNSSLDKKYGLPNWLSSS